MSAATSNQDVSERTFEHKWVLQNWLNVIKDKALLEYAITEIHCEADNLEYAGFSIGLKLCPHETNVRFYYKLLRKHLCLDEVEVKLVIETLRNDGTTWQSFQSQAVAEIDTTINIENNVWGFPSPCTVNDVRSIVSSDGSLTIKLKLTLQNLEDVVSHMNTEEFLNACKNECNQDLASLLDDASSCDVKILTKDKIELLAHKIILRARCLLFAAMFGSDFLENGSGTVNADDISAKTMKVLLKYWYSGELQPCWKDDDIVAEFAYAAGKYQLTKVLEMMNEVLGQGLETSNVVFDLLKVVQNLSLKNAEARLLKRVINQISKTTSGAELFDMFSIRADNLDEENLSTVEILKAFDDVESEQDDIDICSRHLRLLALACKIGMKSVESKLINRIIGTVKKVGSADELFALFDLKIKTNNEGSSDDRGMLVRANSK